MVPRSVDNLESAIGILEAEYEACEGVRCEIEKHKKATKGSPGEKEPFVCTESYLNSFIDSPQKTYIQ